MTKEVEDETTVRVLHVREICVGREPEGWVFIMDDPNTPDDVNQVEEVLTRFQKEKPVGTVFTVQVVTATEAALTKMRKANEERLGDEERNTTMQN